MASGLDKAVRFQGWVLTLSSVIIMVCALVILVASIRKWVGCLSGDARRCLQNRKLHVSFQLPVSSSKGQLAATLNWQLITGNCILVQPVTQPG